MNNVPEESAVRSKGEHAFANGEAGRVDRSSLRRSVELELVIGSLRALSIFLLIKKVEGNPDNISSTALIIMQNPVRKRHFQGTVTGTSTHARRHARAYSCRWLGIWHRSDGSSGRLRLCV